MQAKMSAICLYRAMRGEKLQHATSQDEHDMSSHPCLASPCPIFSPVLFAAVSPAAALVPFLLALSCVSRVSCGGSAGDAHTHTDQFDHFSLACVRVCVHGGWVGGWVE